MKRRNFVALVSMCLIPIRKVFGWNLPETRVIKAESVTYRGTFPPHTTTVRGPIKFDMPGFTKTLGIDESVTLIYDKKTMQWKEVDNHVGDEAA
jgi:hypothetical protein